eukprot:CAMPEP_0194212450 /NCGR_PEP_ID=MMETSP0156-20130528/12345_1 /TAXON_ID=33649 /ORGANISM="Thalassionema nitzschioides, Strain L26-B" /LENGTH=280 /DNA_ID=CAMNT_0038940279 /DNA_START=21 /DNA_END=860 /DNA_ORIENTATION=+
MYTIFQLSTALLRVKYDLVLFLIIFISAYLADSSEAFTVGVVGANGRLGSRVVNRLSQILQQEHFQSHKIQLKEIWRERLHKEYLANNNGFTDIDLLVCSLGSGHLASRESFEVDGLLVQKVISKAHKGGTKHVCLLSSIGVDDFDTEWGSDTADSFSIQNFITDKPNNSRPEVLHWKRETKIHLRALFSRSKRVESNQKRMTHSILRLPHYVLSRTKLPGHHITLPRSDLFACEKSIVDFIIRDVLRVSGLHLHGKGDIIRSTTTELSDTAPLPEHSPV